MSEVIPRTWVKAQDEKDLIRIFEEVKQKAVELGYLKENLVYGPYLMKPQNKAYGYCNSQRKSRTSSSFYSYVAVNQRVLKSKEAMRRVMVHEIAHACDPTEHHSGKWKKIGDKIGKYWNVTVNRTDDYSEFGVDDWHSASVPKYIVECPQCKASWNYVRMSKCVKAPNTFRCPKCDHSLCRVK